MAQVVAGLHAEQPATDARAHLPGAGDEALVLGQCGGLVADLTGLGYPEALPRALIGGEWADVVAVSFTPTAVFAQTPGPGAGSLLAGRR